MSSAAAPAGYGDMGGASFTLAIDSSSWNDKLIRAEGQVKKFRKDVDKEFNGIGMGGAQGLLQLGYAIDDLQYGFKSIVNNIPQIALSFGGKDAMAIAGGVGIAAVAINLLITHWEEIQKLWMSNASVQEAANIKELAEQLKEAAEQAEKYLKAKTEARKFTEAGVEKAIVEGGAEGMLQGIEQYLQKSAPAVSKTTLETVGNQGETRTRAATEEEIDKRVRAQQADITKQAKNIMGAMGTDDATRRSVQQMAKEQPGFFPPGTESKLQAASPEAKVEADQLKEKIKAMDAERKASEEIAKLKKEEADKIKNEIKDKRKTKLDNEVQEKESRIDQLQHKQQILRGLAKAKNHSQTFGGTAAFAGAVMTNALNDPAKQQLKEAIKLNGQIEKLRDDIKRMNNVAKFGK